MASPSDQIATSDLRRLHDALMDEAAKAAPLPAAADDTTAPNVIAYHAARGSANQWISGRAQSTTGTDQAWTAELDAAVRHHYAVAGLIAHLAGTAGNTAAHEAAKQLAGEGLDQPEATAVLLAFIADTIGEDAAATAKDRLQSDLDNGFYTAAIDRLAARYNVGYWRHLDCVKAAAGIPR